MQKTMRLKLIFILASLYIFILLYKETVLNINDLDSSLPSIVSSLLQEFKDLLFDDCRSGLPPEKTKEFNAKWRN